MSSVRRVPELTSEAAARMVEAALARARELGVAVNVAVVDRGGHLVAFRRMDGAPTLSVGIAQRKAASAVAFPIPTDRWYALLKDNPALFHGLPLISGVAIFGGGYPVVVEGEVAGGIGVSGASEEQDMEIARAGLAAIGAEVPT